MPKRLILIFLIICISPSLIFSQTLPFTFSPNTPAKAEEVNSNFQFLAKQFKKNEKTINCPNDNISQAIADGYNHLIINGTCTFTPLITPWDMPEFKQYGFTSIHPTTHLTLEGGTNGVIDKDPNMPWGMLVFAGDLRIKSLTVNQNIYLNTGSRMNVSYSDLTGISAVQGSAVDIFQSTFNCLPDNSCLYASGSSYLRADNITVNISSEGSYMDVTESSFAEIRNSTFNDTSPNSDGGNTFLWIGTNGGVQFEDTNITMNDADIVVEMGGILNLNGGQIVRNNGSPTLRVGDRGTFWEYNDGTIDDIQCDGQYGLIKIDNSSGNVGSISGNCPF